MSRYVISPAAKEDLEAIWDYIGIQNGHPGAAERLIERIHKRLILLSGSPRIGHCCDELMDNLRGSVVGSYVIFYSPFDEGIEVIRVLHGARDINSDFFEEQR